MSTPNQQEENTFELMKGGEAIQALTRGEIDSQIATAKQFPRSIAAFIKRGKEMVTASKEIAAACFYSLPRKDGEGNTKPIGGESVRLAEIVAAAYQNLRTASRVISVEEKAVVAQGVTIDLENNVARSSEVRVRIVNKYGKRYSEDMINVTCNAACAKAARNSVFQVIPKALCRDIIDAAKQLTRGSLAELPERRKTALAWFAEQGVTEKEICAYISTGQRPVKGAADIGLDELELLSGIRNLILDEELEVATVKAGAPQADGAGSAFDTVRTKNAPPPPVKDPPKPADETVNPAAAAPQPPAEPKPIEPAKPAAKPKDTRKPASKPAEQAAKPAEPVAEAGAEEEMTREKAEAIAMKVYETLTAAEVRAAADGVVTLPKKGAPLLEDILKADDDGLGEFLGNVPEEKLTAIMNSMKAAPAAEAPTEAAAAPDPMAGMTNAEKLAKLFELSHKDDIFTVKSAVGAEGKTLEDFLKLSDEDQAFAVEQLQGWIDKRAAQKK